MERVRKYLSEMKIEEAVDRAVTECIQEGILAEFLMKNRAEAIEMSIFEYNEEAHMKSIREEGYDEAGYTTEIQVIELLMYEMKNDIMCNKYKFDE